MKVNPLYLRIVFSYNSNTFLTRRCYSLWVKIAKNEKLRESRRVESDRDQSLQYPGATGLDTPEQARKTKPALINTKKTVSILYETVFY